LDLLKSFAGLAALLSLSAFAYGEQILGVEFDYLNNNEAPPIIATSEAQDLLNVDITPDGLSVKKRSGYGLYKTLGSGQAIHGGHHFFDTSGNDAQVWGSSTSLYGIVADASPTTLVSSATLGSTWDCADTQGLAYCVNSGRNALFRTNGATIAWFTSPLGTMVAVTPDRLLVAGVSGSGSTLYFSEAGNLTNFVVGNDVTSPFTEVIGAPGSRITHIEYACSRILWWKDQSFGYILGTNQEDLQIVTVSNLIGSGDNSSATDPHGNVYFRSQEGHLYKYDCSNIEKLSTNITPNIQVSGTRTENSWTQTTDLEFAAGSLINTSTAPNAGTLYIDYSSTSAREATSWNTASTGWTYTDDGSTEYAWQAGTRMVFFAGGTNSEGWAYRSNTAGNGRWQIRYQFLTGGSLNDRILTMVIFANVAPVLPNSDFSQGYAVRIVYVGNSTNRRIELVRKDDTTVNGGTIIGTYSYTGELDVDRDLYVAHFPNGYMVVNKEGTDIITATDSTYANGSYFGFYGKTSSGGPMYVSNGTIYRPTNSMIGVYLSQVNHASGLTTWDTFNATKADGNGTHQFMMRASTNSFTVNSSTPAWGAVTSGSVITIGTGTYFQVADTMTVTASSNTTSLSDFTVNWFEGGASDKAYATYFNDAIWWSLAFGDGQTANNYIFKYDLLHPGWTLYNFGAGGFLTQNNSLYFGSTSADGRLYKYGDSTSDNGTSISAYWKSKDFPGTDPWLESEYTQIDSIIRRNPGQTLSVGYALNGSTTTTSFNVSLSNTLDTNIRWKKLLPAGKIGGLFNIKYYDDSTTSSWELLGFRVMYKQLPYRPSQ
jgi:hypothetical protein